MSPLHLLGMVTGVTALAAVAQGMARRRREADLARLAGMWGMNYSPRDQIRLTAKVARDFPVPGAAHLKVTDLIYGSDGDRFRYIFTAEYTTGVVHGKRRLVRAGAFSEPRDANTPGYAMFPLLAPVDLSLLDQYRTFAPAPRA